jgi:hypothetical protein
MSLGIGGIDDDVFDVLLNLTSTLIFLAGLPKPNFRWTKARLGYNEILKHDWKEYIVGIDFFALVSARKSAVK